jgi:hypothetical protein
MFGKMPQAQRAEREKRVTAQERRVSVMAMSGSYAEMHASLAKFADCFKRGTDNLGTHDWHTSGPSMYAIEQLQRARDYLDRAIKLCSNRREEVREDQIPTPLFPTKNEILIDQIPDDRS